MRKSILVDLPSFTVKVFEYDDVVKTITNFAVGRPGHQTPVFENGALSLTKREPAHRSSKYPPPNGGALMAWALFFEQDLSCAFHQGDPAVASHGCVHLIERDARWLFDWAGQDPVGLTIRGPYPDVPTARQTLYRLGASNMTRAVVEQLQAALAKAGFDPGGTSGDFDVHTDEAVRAYQRANGLAEDGVVGQTTAGKLGVAF